MSENWPFDEPENLAVFTLKRIVRGESPILRVTHDEEDGGWQFLDGGEVSSQEASLVSLRFVTQVDPSVLEMADLPLGWVAERAGPGEPWRRSPAVSEEDRRRTFASDVEEYGWHVILVPEDGEGPAFAYSVGLFQTFGHPEIIIFGLNVSVMHEIIDGIAEQVKQGRRFTDGEIASGILEGFDVRFCEVARRHYPEYLGCARRFYGDDFTVLQCLWPDRRGRFPSDPDLPEGLRARQPVLAQ